MTEEEKKEYEEFLKWKAEKARLAGQEKQVEVENLEEETGDKDVASQWTQQQNTITNANNEVKKENNSTGLIIVLGIVAILFLFLFVGVMSNKKEVALSDEPEAEEELVAVDTVEACDFDNVLIERTKVVCDFTIEKDEMTDTKNIWAKIISDNSVSQDFP